MTTKSAVQIAFRMILIYGSFMLLVASVTLMGVSAWKYSENKTTTRLISELYKGIDVSIPEDTSNPSLLLARLGFLLRYDELESAQALVDGARLRVSPSDMAKLLYNLANARIRQARILADQHEIELSKAEVQLAKALYREALSLHPQLEDAKFNLEYALRLVRDLPKRPPEDEEAQVDPKRLWTELPGIPRGLP